MNPSELNAALGAALGKAVLKPTALLERLLDAVERQNDIAELSLNAEQRAALAEKDKVRAARALARHNGVNSRL